MTDIVTNIATDIVTNIATDIVTGIAADYYSGQLSYILYLYVNKLQIKTFLLLLSSIFMSESDIFVDFIWLLYFFFVTLQRNPKSLHSKEI